MLIKRVSITCLCIGLVAVGSYTFATSNRQHNTEDKDEILTNMESSFTDESKISNNYSTKVNSEVTYNYESVKGTNKDIIGWINVPNTGIDYPILSGNNNYYLNRTYDRKPSKRGSIFLDENQLAFDKVSLIHGHNMLNSSMFSHLKKFKDKDFFDKTPIYIYDGKTTKTFRAISFIRVSADATFRYDIKEREELKKYGEELRGKGSVKSKDPVNDNDIVILNTCVSDGSGDHNIVIAQEVL